MIRIFRLPWIIVLIMIQGSCGRKQKNIFLFDQQEPKEKIACLTLPCPYTLSATKSNNNWVISWDDCKKEFETHPAYKKIDFLGYFIYPVTSFDFIAKKPYNSNPYTDTSFVIPEKDSLLFKKVCIRTVFHDKQKMYFGPYSKIIVLTK